MTKPKPTDPFFGEHSWTELEIKEIRASCLACLERSYTSCLAWLRDAMDEAGKPYLMQDEKLASNLEEAADLLRTYRALKDSLIDS